MKTQIVKLIALFSFLVAGMAVYAVTADSADNKIKGSWTYSVPDAPYGYQDGTIEFKEADGKLAATAHIGSSVYDISSVKKEGDTYSCSLYLDGSDVKVTLKPDGDTLTGTVVADGWEMPITCKPAKK